MTFFYQPLVSTVNGHTKKFMNDNLIASAPAKLRSNSLSLKPTFQPMPQQKEFVGAILLRSSRTSGSSFTLCQRLDSKLRFAVAVTFRS